MRNLGDKWSLPPFHRAQNMDRKCIIVEFYGGFLINKNGYPTIIHFIFHLPGHISLTKLKFGNKSEPYGDIFTIMA